MAGLREKKHPPRPEKRTKIRKKKRKRKAGRVWKRKNALPDPRRAKMQEMTVEERSTDSDRGIQKIVGNQMLNHAGV